MRKNNASLTALLVAATIGIAASPGNEQAAIAGNKSPAVEDTTRTLLAFQDAIARPYLQGEAFVKSLRQDPFVELESIILDYKFSVRTFLPVHGSARVMLTHDEGNSYRVLATINSLGGLGYRLGKIFTPSKMPRINTRIEGRMQLDQGRFSPQEFSSRNLFEKNEAHLVFAGNRITVTPGGVTYQRTGVDAMTSFFNYLQGESDTTTVLLANLKKKERALVQGDNLPRYTVDFTIVHTGRRDTMIEGTRYTHHMSFPGELLDLVEGTVAFGLAQEGSNRIPTHGHVTRFQGKYELFITLDYQETKYREQENSREVTRRR